MLINSYTTYVINEAQQKYANAYFEINYVNIYSSTKSNVSSSASASSSGTQTVGTRASGSAVSGAAASSSRAAGSKRWEGPSLGWLGGVAAGLFAGVAMVL